MAGSEYPNQRCIKYEVQHSLEGEGQTPSFAFGIKRREDYGHVSLWYSRSFPVRNFCLRVFWIRVK